MACVSGLFTLASAACCALLILFYNSVIIIGSWGEFTDISVTFLSLFFGALGIVAASVGGKKSEGAVKFITVCETVICICAMFLSLTQLMTA